MRRDIQSERCCNADDRSGKVIPDDPFPDRDVRSGGCKLIALFLRLSDVLLVRSLCLRVLGREHVIRQRITVCSICTCFLFMSIELRVDQCCNLILFICSFAGDLTQSD